MRARRLLWIGWGGANVKQKQNGLLARKVLREHQVGGFEIPSTLSLRSHTILLANLFTNNYQVTPPQMVGMAEDTLNQAPLGAWLGRGSQAQRDGGFPFSHLPPSCVLPASGLIA